MKLSLCMIVRDEAEMLPACLESVDGVIDECIVVDTGSTDDTARIAAEAGARVLPYRWQDDFAEARNVSLDAATGDWILVLDADEALAEATRSTLRDTLEQTHADALLVTRRDFAPEGSLNQYADLRILRLFRNRPAYRYSGRIHEQILPQIQQAGGRVDQSNLLLLHYGYQQPTAQGTSRAERNLRVLREVAEKEPGDPYWQYQLGVTYKALGQDSNAEAAFARAFEQGGEISLSRDVVTTMYVKRAQIALAADAYHDAVLYAEHSLRMTPGNLLGLYVAAVACLYLGAHETALPLLRQVKAHPQLAPDQQDMVAALLHNVEPSSQ